MKLSDLSGKPLMPRKDRKKVEDLRHRLVFSHSLLRERSRMADQEERWDKALLNLATRSVMTAIRALDRAAGVDG